jgi:pilus assembly protein CpaC
MLVGRLNRRLALRALLVGLLIAGVHCENIQAQSPSGPAGASALTSSVVNFNVTQSTESLQMIVRSSRILTMDKPIIRYHVQNEELLNVTPVAATQLQVSAVGPGITQVNMWDPDDNLFTVEVIVSGDAREVEAILTTQFPGSNLKVTALSTGAAAVVSGTVNNVDDVDRAIKIVEQFYASVVTNVRVIGVQQIMLHTKIMEVSRTKFRELGVDWALSDRVNGTGVLFSAGAQIDAPATNFTNFVPVPSLSNTRVAAEIGRYDLDVMIKALRQNDLIKVLAEPTVVATHGRPSRFIVGGKVPYIVPTGNGSVAIQYEEFGTSVDFLPFVVGPGRIRLEVRPEVSEPDPARSISIQGTTVPAFRQRYVETAVEMNAGQTFAIAGLLQIRTEAVQRSTPLLGELPWIGTLFRRVSEQNNEIELLITVTPELAEAMYPEQVPAGGPGLNSDSPSDKEMYLRGYIEVPRTDELCPAPIGGDASCEPPFYPQPGIGLENGFAPRAMMPFEDQTNYSGAPIYPTSSPMQVGPNVTIVQPQN